MGYYTKYTLYTREDISEELESKIANEIYNYLFNYDNNSDYLYSLTFNDVFEEELKWYDHTPDMVKISKAYPNLLFILEGHGEEYEDIWREYYLNGKIQRASARIVFDDFDIEELEELI